MVALLAVTGITSAVATPTQPAVAVSRRAAVFEAFRNQTTSPLAAGTHQLVSARVRVLDRGTGAPARGRVWFVDADGVRSSSKVALGTQGWATLTTDPVPGTLPGRYAWHVEYGGSTRNRPTVSAQAATFTVSMPPRDPSADYTWVASPDITNVDVGDVSGMKGFDPHYGNSWNKQTERSIRWVYDTIASYHPRAFLVSGDLVGGHWGLKGNTSGLFGTPSDQVRMLKNMAAFYHDQSVNRLEAAGLFDKTYPAVGDHDIGDNPWANATGYDTFKRNHLDLWRKAFTKHYYYRRDGTPKFFTRPAAGSQWGKTAYAAMLGPDVLLVSLDEFARGRRDVKVEVRGAQLRWLKDVLARARRRGVPWIIVQGHAPILAARMWRSSGLHIAGGGHSSLWKVLVKYHVNIYLAGEVHVTTRRTKSRVTQLVTGSPVTLGKTRFLTVDVYGRRMEIVEHGWHVPPNAPSRGLWQGGCSIPVVLSDPTFARHPRCVRSRVSPGSTDYTGIAPTVYGRLTVYLDGSTSAGRGQLKQYTGPAGWLGIRHRVAPSDAFGPG